MSLEEKVSSLDFDVISPRSSYPTLTPASPRSRGPVPTLFTGIGSISVKLRSFPHFDIRKLRLASLMKWFRGSVNSVLIFTAKGRRFDSRRGLLFFLENSFSSSLRPPTKNQLFLPTIFLRVYDRLSTKRWSCFVAEENHRDCFLGMYYLRRPNCPLEGKLDLLRIFFAI